MLKNWENSSEFISRHIGPTAQETKEMLDVLSCSSMEDLIEKIIPKNILTKDFYIAT